MEPRFTIRSNKESVLNTSDKPVIYYIWDTVFECPFIGMYDKYSEEHTAKVCHMLNLQTQKLTI